MSRTLKPDDRISHYRVLGLLGAGGMGEVYSAQDESLERSVALKILPPRVVRSEERVNRFIREAKSASSLNHPNIVTIYEIGRDAVAASGDPLPVHFISMELIDGETLSQKIHESGVPLRKLVGYVAQAAEGVAKAHAAGIVHRDLKPGNIMVSSDGFAKVLDFGLAKLTEREASSAPRMTSAPTEDVGTGEGVLLGTVDYMSPEQVQAKPADHRSDIFSMGCILYEAASRRRPFVADTDVEVMHQILRDRPAPVEDINPEVPAELRRIIRRCLAKDPDQRFQSMKDLAIDLREVVEHWDSLPVAGSSVSVSRPAPLAASGRTRTWGRIGVVVALVVGIAGLVIGVSSFLSRRASPEGGLSADAPALTTLMSRDDLGEARLSGDGRYLAYVASAGDRSSLSVRQIRTGSDVPILPPQDFPIRGVNFSPDGDYLYFINQDPDQPNYSALFQVPSLGGTPRKVSFDVDTAVTFSPDGNRVCFRRGFPQDNVDTLVIADLKTGEEKTLIRLQGTESFRSPGGTGTPAWSPDGRSIAVSVFGRTAGANGGVRSWIALIDAETGKREDLKSQLWLFIDSLAWMPDGNAIVLGAIPLPARGFQIFRFGLRDGTLVRLTNDLDGYQGVSLSGDGKSIAAIRRTIVSNIWSVPISAGSEARALTSATGSSNSVEFFAPLTDGGVAFTAPRGDYVYVWRMDADGSHRRQLTSRGIYVLNLGFAEGAGIVFSQVEENAILHVWRVDPSGENLRQLTNGAGEQLSAVNPDGTSLLFWKLEEGPRAWSVSPSGGDPKVFLANVGYGENEFSPDGRRVLYSISEPRDGRSYPRYYVMPAGGGEPITSFFLPPGFQDAALDTSGDAVTYVDRGTGFNLMSRSVATGKTDQLTHFSEGRIVRHRWSPDGRRVAVLRTVGPRSSLWILEPRSGHPPTELTAFKTGKIDDFQWARDSKSLVFAYALLNQDIVLMTGDSR